MSNARQYAPQFINTRDMIISNKKVQLLSGLQPVKPISTLFIRLTFQSVSLSSNWLNTFQAILHLFARIGRQSALLNAQRFLLFFAVFCLSVMPDRYIRHIRKTLIKKSIGLPLCFVLVWLAYGPSFFLLCLMYTTEVLRLVNFIVRNFETHSVEFFWNCVSVIYFLWVVIATKCIFLLQWKMSDL